MKKLSDKTQNRMMLILALGCIILGVVFGAKAILIMFI